MNIIFNKFLQNSYNFHFIIANKYNYNRRKETCIYYVYIIYIIYYIMYILCVYSVSQWKIEKEIWIISSSINFYRIRTIFILQSRIFPSIFQRLLGHVCAEDFSLKSKKALSSKVLFFKLTIYSFIYIFVRWYLFINRGR